MPSWVSSFLEDTSRRIILKKFFLKDLPKRIIQGDFLRGTLLKDPIWGILQEISLKKDPTKGISKVNPPNESFLGDPLWRTFEDESIKNDSFWSVNGFIDNHFETDEIIGWAVLSYRRRGSCFGYPLRRIFKDGSIKNDPSWKTLQIGSCKVIINGHPAMGTLQKDIFFFRSSRIIQKGFSSPIDEAPQSMVP